jgi:Leucine-rich repeat (LRR) protein
MKKLILSLFVILYLFQNPTLKAQWVTIPDANFRTFLQAHFPGCISGTMMDTTNVNVVNDTTLGCANLSIADLTGIQYFHNMQYLYCSHNLLTSLPPLPSSLLWLGCDYNPLPSLPALPNNLQRIYCSYDSLTSLPALPATLTYLQCDHNKLISLPTLP